MRDAVRNGPQIHPGAVAVEDASGRVILLNATDPLSREAVAKTLLTPSEVVLSTQLLPGAGEAKDGQNNRALFAPKVVHRHLKTGDVMLLNRQPTLHKPSIMAHKVRVSCLILSIYCTSKFYH